MRDDIDIPEPSKKDKLYGSDALAEMMRELDLPYVALNPGSSFRGLHDSLVNHLGNRNPQMLLCLHEEHAVAIAHGWAKVTEKPLGVILHANVGLMHASMAIYNAWCDRVPMMIFGATGPVDAAKRRPWIDWLHTSRDQAAIVRPYIKWDDQPASLSASLESMMRAARITSTAPMAPTYVCFDVTVQEEQIEAPEPLPDPARHAAPTMPSVSTKDVEPIINMLDVAKHPVFLMGRVSRSAEDWVRRIVVAERYKARVVTDIKTAAAFPTRHPLHIGAPGYFISAEAGAAIAEADLVVSFDWVDLAGTLTQAGHKSDCKVVNISPESLLQNGWSLDHQAYPLSDLSLLTTPDKALTAITAAAAIKSELTKVDWAPPAREEREPLHDGPLVLNQLADLLRDTFNGLDISYLRLPLGWDGSKCDFRDPLDYLGYDGGAGIGSGPGMVIGSALALSGSGRIPVAVLGDGDYLMGGSALWTAARHELPLLIVVANNRSYFNDEVHQEKVAIDRGRPIANKHVGQTIDNPAIDLAGFARSQGVTGIGPVTRPDDVRAALSEALDKVRTGSTVVVDVQVVRGYAEVMSKGMTQE